MRRRDIVGLVGGAAAWPLAVRAQATVRRIGVLMGADEADADAWSGPNAFRKRLGELGWAEGGNVRFDWRWAAGDRDRARSFAAELIALKPDVLFGHTTFVLRSLQQETRTIPIVFASVTDPVANGFVSGLARPGGNITGFADRDPAIGSKLPELLKDIAPHLTRVVIIFNPATAAGQMQQPAQRAAVALGLKPTVAPVNDVRQLEDTIVAFAREPNGGLVVTPDPFSMRHRELIITLAARHELPAIFSLRQFVTLGGLMSYGIDPVEQFVGAASYVDRILKGDKPEDLPVQQPVNYHLVLNLKTAKALSLDIPLKLHAFAGEVIE